MQTITLRLAQYQAMLQASANDWEDSTPPTVDIADAAIFVPVPTRDGRRLAVVELPTDLVWQLDA